MSVRFKKNLGIAASSFLQVFKDFRYIALSAAIFVLVLLFAIWLPNISFIWGTVVSATLSLSQKFGILSSSLGALNTNFTLLSRNLTILVALLFAINISLFAYYFKRRIKLEKAAGVGIGGIIVGFLGVGCAACGSVILSSIFGIGATAGFIGVLPLQGQEFSVLAIGILGFSNYVIAKKIQDPLVCKIDGLGNIPDGNTD